MMHAHLKHIMVELKTTKVKDQGFNKLKLKKNNGRSLVLNHEKSAIEAEAY